MLIYPALVAASHVWLFFPDNPSFIPLEAPTVVKKKSFFFFFNRNISKNVPHVCQPFKVDFLEIAVLAGQAMISAKAGGKQDVEGAL